MANKATKNANKTTTGNNNNGSNANATTPKYTLDAATAKLHVTKGNSKLGDGIFTFSTLPGNEDHLLTKKDGTLLTDIPGTCSKHCSYCFDTGCYAVNSARQYHNTVIKAWGENTLLLRDNKLFPAVGDFITQKNKKKTVVKQFRINVSGEIQSLEEFEAWDDIAANHPETVFAVYTKNYEDLAAFFDKHGDSQDNFVINVSQWHGSADEFLKKYAGRVNVFEYDDSNLKGNTLSEENKERLKGVPACPAVTPDGKHRKDANGNPITCDHCGRCYRKTGATTKVAAH